MDIRGGTHWTWLETVVGALLIGVVVTEIVVSSSPVQRAAQIVRDDAEIVVGEPIDVRHLARGRAAFAIGRFRHQFMLPLAKSGERRRRGGASRAVGAPAMRGTEEGRSGKESGWCL